MKRHRVKYRRLENDTDKKPNKRDRRLIEKQERQAVREEIHKVVLECMGPRSNDPIGTWADLDYESTKGVDAEAECLRFVDWVN